MFSLIKSTTDHGCAAGGEGEKEAKEKDHSGHEYVKMLIFHPFHLVFRWAKLKLPETTELLAKSLLAFISATFKTLATFHYTGWLIGIPIMPYFKPCIDGFPILSSLGRVP